VKSILDAHYLHRDPALARDAIHKLEMGYAENRRLQNGPQNGLAILSGGGEKC
jgi:hypothetical protein